jgi:hypothetical protein
MHIKSIILITGLLCILLAIAGCTGTQNPAVTPVQTPSATSGPSAVATTGVDLNPSPTDVMMDSIRVNVNVEKDYLGNVIVTFQGGAGLMNVRKIDATLNRADGQIKTATVGTRVDDTVTLEGTKSTDRVLVYVTMADGKTYKIVDQLSPYKARP